MEEKRKNKNILNLSTDGWSATYTNLEEGQHAWGQEPCEMLVKNYHNLLRKILCFGDGRVKPRILDLGCGDGRNIKYILATSKEIADLKIVGVDISSHAIERCKLNLKEFEVSRYDLYVGDIVKNTFQSPNSIDLVCCIDVFGQLFSADVENALKYWREIMKPHSFLLLNAYTPDDDSRKDCENEGEPIQDEKCAYWYKNTYYKYYDHDDLKTMMTKAGFKIIDIKSLSWVDPPHNVYRPKEHKHQNWVVVASPAV